MEITYKRQVSYPIGRVLSQYFDLEHVEHVHPQSFGRASLVSEHHDAVVWDLEWPPVLGMFRFRNRIFQQFVAPNRIHAKLMSGLFRGTTVDVQIHQVSDGSEIEERYHIPLQDWPWLTRVMQRAWTRRLDRIWEEDLAVGVCHGGWPGVPRISK